MSNPTTHVESFAGSLGAFSGVAPVRYSDGLWLEQAATNEHYDPRHRHSDSWIASGGTVTYTGSPDYYHEISSATNDTGGRTSQVYATNPMPGIAGAWVFSCDIEYVSGATDWKIAAFEFNSGGSAVVSNALVGNITVVAGTNRYFGVYTPTDGTTARVSFALRRRSSAAGAIRVRDTNIVSGSILSSPVDGSVGSGYSWAGTADNSTSTRAASSASISPAGIFDTYLGAIVFVATPTIETGAEEIWGELGEKLAGADHIRWGRDSTKHPFVEWSGNDSAYTRVTLTATVDAGDEHFYSIEWHVGDTDFRLYLDDDPSENDTIPSPQESYGAGDFVLEATAGGVIYGGLAICSERLTNDQRARLKVVMENRGNIETALDSKRGRYGFFQVRPKVE